MPQKDVAIQALTVEPDKGTVAPAVTPVSVRVPPTVFPDLSQDHYRPSWRRGMTSPTSSFPPIDL